MMVNYKNVIQRYDKNAKIGGDGCSAIEFINNGTSIAKINGLQLNPFASFSPSIPVANQQDVTMYFVEFEAGGNNNLMVVRKFVEGVQ